MNVLSPVQRASDKELVRAWTVLRDLRWFYGLYMVYELFMPDTPALAALRGRIFRQHDRSSPDCSA